MKTVRVAASKGLPRNTPHAPTSLLGVQRAAGCEWINTVIEPVMIVGGGPGGGGCTIPLAVLPSQSTVQFTCAAGLFSIITGPCGQAPVIGGPIVPDITDRSCVIGSPLRAAGNMLSPNVPLAEIHVGLDIRCPFDLPGPLQPSCQGASDEEY